MTEEPMTDVVFRVERYGDFKGDVTAVFPAEPWALAEPYDCACYAHVGQHGACSRAWYRFGTRAATPEEYAPLKAELEAEPYGYRLRVARRWTARHDAYRHETALIEG